ncbi:MAG: DUF6778 family protein [Paracoccaceae bacterium]
MFKWSLQKGFAVTLIVFGLAACSATFRTHYDNAAPVSQTATWSLADVRVAVPQSLSVSEARSLLPRADIVWREDPPGDRRAQVARIMTDAVREGASGLAGSRPVRLDVVVTRFHALTFEAESRAGGGVHNIDFIITAADAETGEVLAGPEKVEAAFPALGGAEMAMARARGESQKSQITAHVRRVIAGWLGIGPDARGTFSRLGG